MPGRSHFPSGAGHLWVLPCIKLRVRRLAGTSVRQGGLQTLTFRTSTNTIGTVSGWKGEPLVSKRVDLISHREWQGWSWVLFSVLLLGGLIAPALRAAPQDQGNDSKLSKAEKRRQKAIQKEMETPYKKWIEEEVPYIITNEEKAAFKKLTTDDEREQFIESFWERRNPNPGTSRTSSKRNTTAHCLRQRALCLGYPGLEDGSWPNLHHVWPRGRNR